MTLRNKPVCRIIIHNVFNARQARTETLYIIQSLFEAYVCVWLKTGESVTSLVIVIWWMDDVFDVVCSLVSCLKFGIWVQCGSVMLKSRCLGILLDNETTLLNITGSNNTVRYWCSSSSHEMENFITYLLDYYAAPHMKEDLWWYM